MSKKKFSLKNNKFFIIIGICLLLYVLSILAMFFWSGMNSLKDRNDFRNNSTGFPQLGWMFSNYLDALTKMDVTLRDGVSPWTGAKTIGILEQYGNTILYTVGCALLGTFVASITAYLCARFKNPVSRTLIVVAIVTISLPIVGGTVSTIELTINLGIYNKIWGMWLMSATFHIGLHFIILYEYYRSMPATFAEAAEIDGASELSVLFRIYFPLAKNIFLTIFLLRLIGLWNDYQTPLLYLKSYPTISYGLYLYTYAGLGRSNVPMKLATSFVVAIPVFIVFCIFQNRIMSNLSVGGIKE